MESIMEYVSDLLGEVYKLQAPIVNLFTGGTLTSGLIWEIAWIVLTLVGIIWVLAGTKILPRMLSLFFVLMLPYAGTVALIIADSIYRKKNGKKETFWGEDKKTTNRFLTTIPVCLSLVTFGGLVVVQQLGMNVGDVWSFFSGETVAEVSAKELISVAIVIGMDMLLLMIPLAFCKLREKERLLYIGEENVDTETMDNFLTFAPKESGQVVLQTELEKPTVIGGMKSFSTYKESQLSGLTLRQEEREAYLSDAVYRMRYEDVTGREAEFVVKSKSNKGALVITLSSIAWLFLLFSPFLLFLLTTLNGFF